MTFGDSISLKCDLCFTVEILLSDMWITSDHPEKESNIKKYLPPLIYMWSMWTRLHSSHHLGYKYNFFYIFFHISWIYLAIITSNVSCFCVAVISQFMLWEDENNIIRKKKNFIFP